MSLDSVSSTSQPYSSSTGGATTSSATSSAAAPGGSASAGTASTESPPPRPAAPPSATVTLSDRALDALHGNGASSSASSSSVYTSLKNGIEAAVDGVENAVSDSAHWLVDGAVSAVTTVDHVVHGVVDLPFVAVSKTCDAIGSVLDAI